MAFFPPEDEYQNRVNAAWTKHVAKHLRYELRDTDVPTDAPDEDVIRFYRDTNAADATPEDFDQYTRDMFGKTFVKPNQSFMEGAGGVARSLKAAAPSMARQVGENIVGAAPEMMRAGALKAAAAKAGVELSKDAMKVGTAGARKLAAPIIGGAYFVRMLAQKHAADKLGQIADAMPAPDFNELYNHYYDSLAPGLQQEGMSLDDIAREVNRRVHGVIKGYVDTQNSLMGDIDRTSEDYLQSAGDAAANVAIGGLGGGLFKDVLESGARKFMGKQAEQALEKTVAGRVITHTVTGAGIGGVYGGAKAAMESSLRGESAGQIAGNTVHDALTNAAGGAILGGLAGSVGEGVGAVAKPVINKVIEAIGMKAKVDAAIASPKPAAPEAPPQHSPRGFTLQGVEPGTQEPPVGTPEWWRQSEGLPEPTTRMQGLSERPPGFEVSEQRRPMGIAESAAEPSATHQPVIGARAVEPSAPYQPVIGGPVERVPGKLTPYSGPFNWNGTPAPKGGVTPIDIHDLPPDQQTPPPGGEAIEPHAKVLPKAGVEKITDAVKAMGNKVEGAAVRVRPSADGQRLHIEDIKGAEHGSGASGKALDRIVATADAHGTPIDVTVNDRQGPRGGTISAEKTAQWYEKRGFYRTTTGEGSISLHRPVPTMNPPIPAEDLRALMLHHLGEPDTREESEQLESFIKRSTGLDEPRLQEALGNTTEGRPMIQGAGQSGQPSVGMRLGSWLDQQAVAADERIRTKLGRLSSGFDPSLIGDYAIKAAAKMYRFGMASMQTISRALRKEHPDIPAASMKQIITQAREIIKDRLGNDKVTVAKLKDFLGSFEEGRVGMDWYNKTAPTIQKLFGQDGDMMLRFLAATSAGMSADANVTLAMKAYGQWKLGLPFDGFIENHQLHLENATRGEVFGDRKLQGILAAMRGDPNAVAIDRHVMRMLGFEEAGQKKSSLTGPEYDFFEAVIRDLAKKEGVAPREFQAAQWVTSKMRKAQEAQATGNARAMAHAGTFRPYEGIMKFDHGIHDEEGGLTPQEWVSRNRVTLEHLNNASRGVDATRAGGGFTYSPYDYSAYKGNHGIVTTLASVKIPTNKLSGSEVIDFTQKFKKLLASYYGMNTGSFNLDQSGDPGMSSLDLNVVLPESMRDRAIKLGKARGQRLLYNLATGELIPTGYKGETMDAPADPRERGAWWNKQRTEIDRILQEVGVPSRALPEDQLKGEPHQRLTSASQFWGVEAENAMPPEVHKALEAATTPEELTQVIAENEPALAAALNKQGLAASSTSLSGDGSATDLLRHFMEKKGIDHKVMLGTDNAGNPRVWVKTDGGAELDPAGEGMQNGRQVRDTAKPELRRGQVEAMVRTPHRWDIYAQQALGMTEAEVHALVDEGKLRPVSDAGLINHVEVHKDGSVWEYVDPSAENGYQILVKGPSFNERPVTDVLRYIDSKNVLSGHDVVQNMRSQAGFIAIKGADKLESFAKTNPPARVNPALISLGGKVVKPEDYRYQRPHGVSLWIDPDGKTLEVPFHLRSADAAIRKLKLKNPVTYEGPEHDDLQAILNLGYVRVQLHEGAYAADATRPLTGGQIQALRQLRRGDGMNRDFAGRWTMPNGEHRMMFTESEHGQNALNKYVADSPEESEAPSEAGKQTLNERRLAMEAQKALKAIKKGVR